MSAEPAAPRDAATVVLLRDEPGGLSVFMVRRHAKSGFMAGAYVFPGGGLEAGDRAPELFERTVGRTAREAASALGEDDPERSLALHVTALRELFEEAGVLLARDLTIPLDGARARLLAGAPPFAELVAELGVSLDAGALTPLSRWVTPEVEPRRFDARFFLAVAPPAQRAAHDHIEVTDGLWLRPRDALARGATGEIQLPPPTLRTLELLGRHARAADAIRDARSRRPPLVRPAFRDLGEGRFALTLPGDPDHPERERAIDGPTRFVLAGGVFRSVDP